MNEGIILLGWVPGYPMRWTFIIQAQVWADGQSNPINDEIMESDGTLQRLFWGDYEGPGPGPVIPMNPIPPDIPIEVPPGTPLEIVIPSMNRLYEANDVRMFEAEDNRIFEA